MHLKLFPAIHDSLDEGESSNPPLNTGTKDVKMSENDRLLMWNIYCISYGKDEVLDKDKIDMFRSMAITSSSSIISSLLTKTSIGCLDTKASPVAIYALSKYANRLMCTSEELKDSSFEEFHWMSNTEEVLNIMPLLHELISKVQKLLNSWPGNNVLLDIMRSADRILRLPTTSSIFQVLSKVENLTRVSQLWEQVARKEDSLKKELSGISRMIIKWRKHEINCWSKLLEYQDNCFQKTGLKWWFHIYSLLSDESSPSASFVKKSVNEWIIKETQLLNDSPWKDVYDALDSFIRTSPLGEFQLRLKMLKRFSDQCHLEAECNYRPQRERG